MFGKVREWVRGRKFVRVCPGVCGGARCDTCVGRAACRITSVYLGIGIGRELLKHFHNFVLA